MTMRTTASFREEFDSYGNTKKVADVEFTDVILGEGSYGTVKLGKRKKRPLLTATQASNIFMDEGGSSFGSEGEIWSNDLHVHVQAQNEKHHNDRHPQNGGSKTKTSCNAKQDNGGDGDDYDDLVAVKIYSKTALKKIREITRSKRNNRRMSIHDTYEKAQKEIEILKLLPNHPNLVHVHEVIDSIRSDTIYIVLEYVQLGAIMTYDQEKMQYRGLRAPNHEPIFDPEKMQFHETKKKFSGLIRDGCYKENIAALFFVDMLHGLRHLHQHHICHRDLKPENVLIDERGFAKISDFGVSYLFEDEIGFQSGRLTKREGTYSFWSPEMLCSESDFNPYTSDLWACGMCLYVFVTGKVPFYADDPSQLFEMISKQTVQLDAKFSEPLKELLSQLLEKDPECRADIEESLSHSFCKRAREDRILALGLGTQAGSSGCLRSFSHSTSCCLQ